MAKAYWIAFYRSISNPDALAAYAKLAGPAIAAAGGRFLARGNAAKAYESGVAQRVVVIEFDSIDKAVAAHDSEGYQAAGITGIRQSTSNPALTLPAEVRDYPNVVSQAVSALRLAGVGGPFSLLLSADAYTMVSETSDHGYPIREHLARVIDGEIIWAPAIDGAFLLSARGGDFELRLGQDLSIGYLTHDAGTVQLYFQEALTFLVYTTEASVALTAGGAV